MKRFIILCWIVAGTASALILFQIKQEVHDLEQEIAETRADILRDQEAVHVLEAEWSYLNSPARLSALAERHLNMAPLEADRIIGFEDLPLPGAPEGAPDHEGSEPAPTGKATLVKAPAAGALGQ